MGLVGKRVELVDHHWAGQRGKVISSAIHENWYGICLEHTGVMTGADLSQMKVLDQEELDVRAARFDPPPAFHVKPFQPTTRILLVWIVVCILTSVMAYVISLFS